MSFDTAALMGYTGAVFHRFFGSFAGVSLAAAALLGWIASPLVFGLRRSERRDF